MQFGLLRDLEISRWRAFAASVAMRAPLPMRFEVYASQHALVMRAVFVSADRDTGEPRELTSESHSLGAGSWDRRHEIVLEMVQWLYQHEILEHLTFSGVRRFDPHPGES